VTLRAFDIRHLPGAYYSAQGIVKLVDLLPDGGGQRLVIAHYTCDLIGPAASGYWRWLGLYRVENQVSA